MDPNEVIKAIDKARHEEIDRLGRATEERQREFLGGLAADPLALRRRVFEHLVQKLATLSAALAGFFFENLASRGLIALRRSRAHYTNDEVRLMHFIVEGISHGELGQETVNVMWQLTSLPESVQHHLPPRTDQARLTEAVPRRNHTARKAEKAERDRALRKMMRGPGGGGGENQITNPKTIEKRAKRVRRAAR